MPIGIICLPIIHAIINNMDQVFAKPLEGDPYAIPKLESRIEFLELDIDALLQYYVSGYQTSEKENLILQDYYINLKTGKIALKVLLTPPQ